MAKISTYGITDPPLVGDKVIGTDVNGTPTDATKNFTVESIAALAGTEGLVTLTQVLTANNTANDLSIVLTGTGSLNAVNSTLSGTLGVAGESTFSGNVVLSSTLTAGGVVGTNGQLLSSTGLGVTWIDHDTLNPDLQEVLDVGNSALNTDLILSGSGELTAWGLSIGLGGSTFLSNVTFGSTITAGNGTGVGIAGQALASRGAGLSPQWITLAGIPTITQVLNAGDNASGHDITNLNSISTDNIVASGAVGVLDQLMQSTGGGITWVSSVNLTTVQTDNLIMDGGTISADGSVGIAGQVLSSQGAGLSPQWINAASGGGLTWLFKIAAYTAVDGDMVGVRTAVGALTISPPTTPTVGMKFGVQDASHDAAANNITIDFNSQGTRWNSQASDLLLTKDSCCVIFEYASAQVGWALVGGAIP